MNTSIFTLHFTRDFQIRMIRIQTRNCSCPDYTSFYFVPGNEQPHFQMELWSMLPRIRCQMTRRISVLLESLLAQCYSIVINDPKYTIHMNRSLIRTRQISTRMVILFSNVDYVIVNWLGSIDNLHADFLDARSKLIQDRFYNI